MAIGSFMGRVFTVSHTKIFTPSNLKGSTGSDWATHEVVGGKARSEWVGPKLKSYTFDLLLRAQDGVPPRSTLDYFQRMAESSAVNHGVPRSKGLPPLMRANSQARSSPFLFSSSPTTPPTPAKAHSTAFCAQAWISSLSLAIGAAARLK